MFPAAEEPSSAMSDAIDLEALLVELRESLARVHARLGAGPFVLGPVELELRGRVTADGTGMQFTPGGSGEVRALFVQAGPEAAPPPAPELLGLTRSAAVRRARSAGASLEVTDVPCLSPEQAGRVCWQRPAAGGPLREGRIAVGLYVSR
ncbi:hypothetical protein D7W79_31155 [Corallococcus exercitus]|uniref:PASTA domain-containing protein n=1 Tax=Corallococcus exercitus TaxID=2316736 RepID=A0A3A8HIF4_9BACT|nr:PASTA domain-containing protein [Corallococcus exercitus]NOK38428.1 hypothetical protein [Corallococcus exercitus]RKG71039.1 hypothetical protein D7W79_31155 [Corallococcus exercitus]